MSTSSTPHAPQVPERLSAALGDRYRVERELGSGGMATVYLAYDLKHDRRVAVKVLRAELAAVIGAERFLAEIKTTANLQHPHILPLHDSGSVDGILFYVMPYIDGESLRDRLAREHQLPVSESVRLATEIAGALDYAHRHGVVHRDIKPENILLHDGGALVADFGISLAASTAGGRMTETGMSLGTPHYMSPEQAMGEREITPRTDVYALGCVTYEMLVGEPPFTGPTAQAIVARVMTEEPRGLTVQRKSIPFHVENAVQTALSKLPADRFASTAEFAAALNDPGRTGSIASSSQSLRRTSWIPIAIAGAGALAAGLLLGMFVNRPTARMGSPVVRVMMTLPDSGGVRPIDNVSLAISPDGNRVVYVGPSPGGTMLWLREMNDFNSKPLPGTEAALAPFFSPDGESVGFFTGEANTAKLLVTPTTGGMIRTIITDSTTAFGGSWGHDGNIYFTANGGGIARVPADGGKMVRVSRPDTAAGQQEHDFIDVLPNGKGGIVQIWRGSIGENEIAALSFKTGKATKIATGSYARFLPPDKVVYGTADGRVFAIPFDPGSLKVTGDPVQMLDKARTELSNGTVQFAVSASGTLVYIPGSAAARKLVWVSRAGTETFIDSTWVAGFTYAVLSPDGAHLALAISGTDGDAIWVKRLPNGSLTRLTLSGSSDRPVWTPDGFSVAYLGTREGKRSAWMRRADGSNEERKVNRNSPPLDEVTFSNDGRWNIFRTQGSGAGTRKLLAAVAGSDSTPRVLLKTDHDNYAAALSPNGRWIAYVSNESRQAEVYVRPFPSVDSARWTISVNGGYEPLWSRSGTEIFFRTPRGDMMATSVTAGNTFRASPPMKLFTATQFSSDEYSRRYDVTSDGRRFIMMHGSTKDSPAIGVILNWASEINRAAAKK